MRKLFLLTLVVVKLSACGDILKPIREAEPLDLSNVGGTYSGTLRSNTGDEVEDYQIHVAVSQNEQGEDVYLVSGAWDLTLEPTDYRIEESRFKVEFIQEVAGLDVKRFEVGKSGAGHYFMVTENFLPCPQEFEMLNWETCSYEGIK